MSPHILIDEELETLTHPSTPISWSVMIQKQLTEMMADTRITIDEFNHYCKRLNAIIAGRREAA
ncbi:hypothetical protein [Pseudomonas putida]|uniref:hypothetical protein n=1 Tax=Pseudomonas putida TaxID=303 RepID=UPI002366E3C4|nr:hypothetical protein [Pseudomonas putida]MDD2046139.1 hypothetical protein [Pseudomonas putida]